MQFVRKLVSSFLKVFALVVTLYSVSLLGFRLSGFDFAVVASDSMAPTIKTGDLVILQNTSYADLSPGQIIQYQKNRQLILHRIQTIHENGLVTKGDANAGPDPLEVVPNQVKAVAHGSLKGFGLPLLLLKNFLHHESTYANFTSNKTSSAEATSAVWINPVAKWKQITGGGTYTFVSPSSVSSSGQGNRTILLNKNLSTDSHFFSQLQITTKDASNSTVYMYFDVCLNVSTLTCGWAIGLSESNQRITIQTISATGSRQAPIFVKNIPLNLATPTKVMVSISTIALQVILNGELIINIQNPIEFASSQGVNVPSGSYLGFSTVNSNQFTSSKSVSW